MHAAYGSRLYARYGFLDSFNPSFTYPGVDVQRGTVMEVGDDRFEFAYIRALYDSEDYPLPRATNDETDSPD